MTKLFEHLEKLPAFAEILRQSSMRRAAESLSISQPALSRSVKILEQSTGKVLLRRTGKGIEPTPEGLIIEDFWNSVKELHHKMEAKLQKLNTVVGGEVKIGTYESIAIYFWPEVIRSLSEKFPKLSIKLHIDRSDIIYKKLLAGELDLIMVVNPKPHPRLEASELFEDTFRAYVSTGLEFFRDRPVIFSSTAFKHIQFDPEKVLVSFGLAKNSRYETESFEVISAFTKNGVGIGLLPGKVAAPLISQGKIRSLNPVRRKKGNEEFGPHQICLVRAKGSDEEQNIMLVMHECLARMAKW